MSQATDPFTGTWELDAASSNLPWPAPHRMITVIDSDLEVIRIREEIVDNSGQNSIVALSARFDGKDYPVNGSPLADAVAYERVDSRTIRGVIKRQGAPIVAETVVISEDSTTFRGDYVIPAANGGHITGFAIHKRVRPGES
jgi:hypothetical protein